MELSTESVKIPHNALNKKDKQVGYNLLSVLSSDEEKSENDTKLDKKKSKKKYMNPDHPKTGSSNKAWRNLGKALAAPECSQRAMAQQSRNMSNRSPSQRLDSNSSRLTHRKVTLSESEKFSPVTNLVNREGFVPVTKINKSLVLHFDPRCSNYSSLSMVPCMGVYTPINLKSPIYDAILTLDQNKSTYLSNYYLNLSKGCKEIRKRLLDRGIFFEMDPNPQQNFITLTFSKTGADLLSFFNYGISTSCMIATGANVMLRKDIWNDRFSDLLFHQSSEAFTTCEFRTDIGKSKVAFTPMDVFMNTLELARIPPRLTHTSTQGYGLLLLEKKYGCAC